jgi:hypothetical protein
MNMKKKVYIIVMIALVLIIIAEGFVIYTQHTIIKKNKEEKEAHENYEREYIRRLSEQLKLERKGLRHDTRGGDFCPACEGRSVAIIRYGYWTSGMWEEEIYNKEVKIGGCVVSENSKRFCCNDCGYKWGSLDSDNIDEHNGSVLYNATRNEIRIKKVEKMDVASLAIICK